MAKFLLWLSRQVLKQGVKWTDIVEMLFIMKD
jgi:hypothetical protein